MFNPILQEFWEAVEKEVGRIPLTVKCTLEYTGYINAALGDLGDTEIAEIEQDIRKIPPSTSNISLLKCFEKFDNKPQDFRFLAGERAILKLLAATVKKRGINRFFKKEKATLGPAERPTPAKTISSLSEKVHMDDEAAHASLIRARVVKYYQTRFVINKGLGTSRLLFFLQILGTMIATCQRVCDKWTRRHLFIFHVKSTV